MDFVMVAILGVCFFAMRLIVTFCEHQIEK